MNQIVIIGKTGKVKTQKVNSLTLETLYKKCKFQKSDNFEKRHTWKIQDTYFSIYSNNSSLFDFICLYMLISLLFKSLTYILPFIFILFSFCNDNIINKTLPPPKNGS